MFKWRVSQGFFNHSEINLINRYGELFFNLIKGRKQPINETEKSLMDVGLEKKEPITDIESALYKYMLRLNWEKENPGLVDSTTRKANNDGFAGSREAFYKEFHRSRKRDEGW
ncbi:MAG TPA: hypothetical protein ENN79_03500 [Desulfobacteraceae bacterium]|nr:hypothetical protein [Desulfobacteraceae bacterium]